MISNTPGNIGENSYLSETNFPIIKSNYVIISGCSGGGKSTLLSELANRGFSVVLEPGRQIVKEQTAINGDALPWINLEKFLDLALSRYIFRFNALKEQQQTVFFDRGIIDAVQLDISQPEYFRNAAFNFRYNRLVFLVPPWKEIFTSDSERKHDFESANKEYEELLIKYKNFGYETIFIPKVSVKERVDFILKNLGISTNIVNESNFFISRSQRLLEWNKQKLTCRSELSIDDLKDLFAPEFVVTANGRTYDANYQNYFEFLNKFRANIDTIDYEVQEYLTTESAVIMPLKAVVKYLNGDRKIFDAIMLIKFNDSGKIVHWQEVYSMR